MTRFPALRLLSLAVAAVLLAAVNGVAAESVAIPNFWDPKSRLDKPDLAGIRTIRFLTDDEFPPLHFANPDGRPVGFSVDLARAACDKLRVACTIQTRRFDTLLTALEEKRGDAIAAAIPIAPALLDRFSVTRPYHRTPARFAVRERAGLPAPSVQSLATHTVGVVQGSAHEAYLKAFFDGARITPFPDMGAAQAALKASQVDYLFGDGMSLSIWLGGRSAEGCCAFAGGPYLSQRFFGEGVGFVVRRDDLQLQRALDYALQALWDDGTYADLYLRYFPISFY
ncbi:transporter substrate-binding domain-containing protein [Chelatococcus reniformis]|uniref:ABC transporter substrate-binding protein n=1 Tax=Chelatococcus reniformis TaxID=1494448 RepID=A0A916UXN4_9HYPH|nr:transporter substrate-binding domain-containing protein [Chelatococcus reniformis]GGC93431.1 ABC transporter substrate-binding protein [Chelatococcus reniformis]